jgi:2-oxoglutarate ferredoxin oxidoreductase subunit beta
MPRDMAPYLREEVKHTAFCPGCGNGILMGALLRAIDGLGLDMKRVLFVSGIGCSAWIPSPHFKADTLHTLHGRPRAVAPGAKLANPSLEVIVISGDGDLSSIGGNHLIHAARRGIKLTIICSNNFIYGMTGGQVASTTPQGDFSATTPPPRGNPYAPFDLVSLVLAAGASYAARWPVTRPVQLIESLKKAIGAAGVGFVDALTPCPTQYGRRNRYGEVTELFDGLEAMCVERSEADGLTAAERKRKIIVGEFEALCP